MGGLPGELNPVDNTGAQRTLRNWCFYASLAYSMVDWVSASGIGNNNNVRSVFEHVFVCAVAKCWANKWDFYFLLEMAFARSYFCFWKVIVSTILSRKRFVKSAWNAKTDVRDSDFLYYGFGLFQWSLFCFVSLPEITISECTRLQNTRPLDMFDAFSYAAVVVYAVFFKALID